MKTEVDMKRKLFDTEIAQKSKSEFFSATDLIKAGNHWRALNKLTPFDVNAWYKQNSTKEFMLRLEKEFGQIKIGERGRGHHTWVHPLLFIDMALAISPDLKIEVYKWLYDSLLKNRNNSGDSYKRMCGALFVNEKNKAKYSRNIVKLANKIRAVCDVTDWQHATEEQLELRNKIHYNIEIVANVLRNNSQAIKYGISEATKEK